MPSPTRITDKSAVANNLLKLSTTKATAISQAISNWYLQNPRPLPWRLSREPYKVWLSEVMLQQTVIAAVLPVYEAFIKRFPSIESVAYASETEVRKFVAGLGYYRRFSLFHQAAKKLVAQSQGGGLQPSNGSQAQISWPQSFEQWKDLPGVGEYTAAAVSSIVLGAFFGVVDGNVERVLCRIGDIRTPPNLPYLKKIFKEVVQSLISKTPSPGDFNQGIMELGQLVCTPSNPRCEQCPLTTWCLAFANRSQSLAPQKKLRVPPKSIRLRALVLQYRDKIGMVSRGQGAKFLRGIDGFPLQIALEDGVTFRDDDFSVADSQCNGAIHHLWEADTGEHWGFVKHHITNHKIHCEVLRIRLKSSRGLKGSVRWYQAKDLRGQLVSSLDSKVWDVAAKHLEL